MKKLIALVCVLMLLVSCTAYASEIVSTGVCDGMLRFKDGRNYGYMDINGNVVIPAKYIGGEDFNNGLAPVQYSSGGFARWKYINLNGDTAIGNIDTSTRYYEYGTWQGDYGMVTIWKIKNGSIEPIGYNYINASGRLINSTEYMYIGTFSEGYALVGEGSAYGKLSRSSGSGAMFLGSWSGNDFRTAATDYYFIDLDGNKLGSNAWASAKPFSEGYAAVAIAGADGSYVWGFVDQTGNIAIAPQWKSVSNFANGYAVVSDGEYYGAIDAEGNLVVDCCWTSMSAFADNGLAAVKSGDLWGYVDATGSVVIEPAFASAFAFNDGAAIVYDGFAYGVIDAQGEFVIHPGYRFISRLDGLFVAEEFNAPVIVNENGEVITVLLRDGALPTEDQIAGYEDGEVCKLITAGETSNGLTMKLFMDAEGNTISMNMFSEVPGEEFRIALCEGKRVILNAQGEAMSAEKWDDVNISASTAQCICIVKNNLYGYVTPEGEYLLQPQFSSVGSFRNGVGLAFMGQNITVIDEFGSPVLPTIHKGSPKEEIKRLQQALLDQGYLNDVADGIYGGKTDAAVRAAQEAFGMEVNGVADSAFQHRLFGE